MKPLLKNVGSNSLGYVVNVVVGICLTPYVVAKLGRSAYGVWTLVVSFVGYYGLLDVGIRSAVGHFVATYHARREPALVNRTLSTAMALMLGVAAVAVAISLLAADGLPEWYRHLSELKRAAEGATGAAFEPESDPAELRTVVMVMGLGFAFSFPMALYGTVIYSVQRIALQNAIGITQLIVRALLTVWALAAGHGLLGLACVAVGCNVLGWIATTVAAYRVLPGLSLAFRHCRREGARELVSYGGFNVLVNVGDTLLLYTAGFVIFQALRDPADVTYYAIPATTLIPYFMQVVQSVTWAFTPYFTGRWAVGNVEDVRRLLLVGTRGVMALAALLAGGLYLLGRGFLAIWQRPEFSADPRFADSVDCLKILAIATLLRASQSCGRQVLFAMREVRYLGVLAVIEAVASVLLGIVLVRTGLGIVGVALGTLIPVLVTQGFVQPRHLLRELGVGWRRYVIDSARASVPILLAMGLADALLGSRLEATSWGTFVARAVVVTFPALVVGFFTALDRDERRAVLAWLRPTRG